MIVRVVIEPGEDGYFVVHCPTLKTCCSQGKTREGKRSETSASQSSAISNPKPDVRGDLGTRGPWT